MNHSAGGRHVEAPEGTSSFGVIRFKQLIEHVLGREIDLVSYGGLKAKLDDDIRRDAAVMDRKAAKELLHIEGWLERVHVITQRRERGKPRRRPPSGGRRSLMMKLGEAANRLSRLGVLAPDGVEWALAVANRNFIIHQYDEINRELTRLTLSRDLPRPGC